MVSPKEMRKGGAVGAKLEELVKQNINYIALIDSDTKKIHWFIKNKKNTETVLLLLETTITLFLLIMQEKGYLFK